MKKLLKSLQGYRQETPPIWLMRQAGRHLPEYLELRKKTETFLEFCYSPEPVSYTHLTLPTKA